MEVLNAEIVAEQQGEGPEVSLEVASVAELAAEDIVTNHRVEDIQHFHLKLMVETVGQES